MMWYTFLFIFSFVFISYTYFGYPLLLIFFSFFKQREFPKNDKKLTAALVVPVYNEEKVIEKKIKNCLSLDYPVNIYFVSDGSTDRTNELIKKHKRVNLIVVSKRQGKAEALNSIIPRLKEEIIVLSDANTLIEKNSVTRLIEDFGTGVGVVCGKYLIPDSGTNEGSYWHLELLLKRLENGLGFSVGASGALYAFRRELYDKLKRDTIIDDMVIPISIQLKGQGIVFEERATCFETRKITLKKEFVRRVRMGAGAYQTAFYLKSVLNPFKGLLSIGFYSHKLFRWLLPFLLITLLISTFFLTNIPVLNVFFILQVLFYLFALVGMFVNFWLFTLPYYFIIMNLAFFFGFFKFIFGMQKATWERVG